MESLAVIKHFNIFKHGLFSLVSSLIGLLMNQLGFQGMKEDFRNRSSQPKGTTSFSCSRNRMNLSIHTALVIRSPNAKRANVQITSDSVGIAPATIDRHAISGALAV
jgi:hypothetical protein